MPMIEWNHDVVSDDFVNHPSQSADAADTEIRKSFPKAYYEQTDIDSLVVRTYFTTKADFNDPDENICHVIIQSH